MHSIWQRRQKRSRYRKNESGDTAVVPSPKPCKEDDMNYKTKFLIGLLVFLLIIAVCAIGGGLL
jgi:hypothetical protein